MVFLKNIDFPPPQNIKPLASRVAFEIAMKTVDLHSAGLLHRH